MENISHYVRDGFNDGGRQPNGHQDAYFLRGKTKNNVQSLNGHHSTNNRWCSQMQVVLSPSTMILECIATNKEEEV